MVFDSFLRCANMVLPKNFLSLFGIFGVEVGGWVGDPPFKWFWDGRATSAEWQDVYFPM